MTQILEQLGVDSEDAKSLDMVKNLGTKIQCLNCSVPILMTFPMMVCVHTLPKSVSVDICLFEIA